MQKCFEVEIGVTRDRTQFLENNAQAKSKKYGMNHHSTRTIHTDMVDTLQSTET